ncbi:ABC transporter ATP-binding protein [Gottschalkia acidurici 9a]|uniref:ABC transporter ATP-binding protein n=1 Tax=Gottschalkia acidurici (strain ATCC 7906 / DSM 604 / BCRC 14475 / CIP 104303 / KCTC 5404 / NCIMB 10678 / 9a) TaxID=1128398 RepID=K0AXX1_GOTA9|nr:ABC transporter ATP-binding protein [Gottschalkia acidurici]AFS77595.1 ABC transporter ATP-binding protein [Gottschalkia acidurici 9a]
MSNNILEVKNLRKEFTLSKDRKIKAVKGISFDVRRGEVFGFLGPNGAGKSTTISMLTTQKEATSGDILIDGESLVKNPAHARRKIGVVAQHNNLDRGLTARENLIYHAKYFGIDNVTANKRADEYLEKFGLTDRQHDYVRSYSGGMAQRLKIARAIMHNPDILFLDEPTTGLDPSYRTILWEQMLALNKAGTTIFLTTHYMEEPEKLCDRIAIVDQGELKGIGTADELKALIPTNNIVTIKLAELKNDFVKKAKTLPDVKNAVIQNGLLLLYMKNEHPDFNNILEWVKTLNTSLQNISLSTSTLDDVFIHLTGKGSVGNGESK